MTGTFPANGLYVLAGATSQAALADNTAQVIDGLELSGNGVGPRVIDGNARFESGVITDNDDAGIVTATGNHWGVPSPADRMLLFDPLRSTSWALSRRRLPASATPLREHRVAAGVTFSACLLTACRAPARPVRSAGSRRRISPRHIAGGGCDANMVGLDVGGVRG